MDFSFTFFAEGKITIPTFFAQQGKMGIFNEAIRALDFRITFRLYFVIRIDNNNGVFNAKAKRLLSLH